MTLLILTTDLVSRIIMFMNVSYFFNLGIPLLMCIRIFGWRSVAYYFLGNVTLTFDLIFRIIVPGAYLHFI